MKVFVTGATGFVGFHLIQALVKKEHQVTCLVRNPKAAQVLKHQGYQTKVIDLDDPHLETKLLPLLKKMDWVFHLGALFAEWGPKPQDYQKTNVRATQKLLQASWESNLKHFIFISTAHIMGNPPPKTPAMEDSSTYPASPYSRSKLTGEKLVLAYQNKGLPTTIIRPTFIYGPKDKKGAINRFLNQVKLGKILIVGDGHNQLQIVYVKDLVEALIKAAEKKGQGETYLIAGSQKISLEKLLKLMAKTQGIKSLKITKIPVLPALILSYPAWLVFKIGHFLKIPLLKNEPVIEPRKVHFITGNFTYDIQKAEKELGWRPKYNLEKGLKETTRSKLR